MRIQFTNLTKARPVSQSELAQFITAFALQVRQDFAPAWGLSPVTILAATTAPDPSAFEIALVDTSDVPRALGCHDKDGQGKPRGFVFVKTCEDDGEDWRTCASHEGLELIGDRFCATWVLAGDGKMRAFEMCDAVEGDKYMKAGVPVSNFLLPPYFSDARIVGARSDFLNRLQGAPAPAMSPGGYDIVIDTQGDPSQEFAKVQAVHASLPQRKQHELSRTSRRVAQAAKMLNANRVLHP